MSYASYTRDTREPLKAIAHSRRFQQAANIISALPTDRVLDYGCADGHLFGVLPEVAVRVGYDPDPKLIAEMEPEIRHSVVAYTDISRLLAERRGRFTLITCMEVCEHLTDAALDQLIENVTALAAPRARFVFGVPIETGPSGFLKALYRLARRGRQEGATLGDAIRSLFRMPIKRVMTDHQWFGHHTGFDHQALRARLERAGFKITETKCLPVPALGTLLNNEVYFVCSKAA